MNTERAKTKTAQLCLCYSSAHLAFLGSLAATRWRTLLHSWSGFNPNRIKMFFLWGIRNQKQSRFFVSGKNTATSSWVRFLLSVAFWIGIKSFGECLVPVPGLSSYEAKQLTASNIAVRSSGNSDSEISCAMTCSLLNDQNNRCELFLGRDHI